MFLIIPLLCSLIKAVIASSDASSINPSHSKKGKRENLLIESSLIQRSIHSTKSLYLMRNDEFDPYIVVEIKKGLQRVYENFSLDPIIELIGAYEYSDSIEDFYNEFVPNSENRENYLDFNDNDFAKNLYQIQNLSQTGYYDKLYLKNLSRFIFKWMICKRKENAENDKEFNAILETNKLAISSIREFLGGVFPLNLNLKSMDTHDIYALK